MELNSALVSLPGGCLSGDPFWGCLSQGVPPLAVVPSGTCKYLLGKSGAWETLSMGCCSPPPKPLPRTDKSKFCFRQVKPTYSPMFVSSEVSLSTVNGADRVAVRPQVSAVGVAALGCLQPHDMVAEMVLKKGPGPGLEVGLLRRSRTSVFRRSIPAKTRCWGQWAPRGPPLVQNAEIVGPWADPGRLEGEKTVST